VPCPKNDSYEPDEEDEYVTTPMVPEDTVVDCDDVGMGHFDDGTWIWHD